MYVGITIDTSGAVELVTAYLTPASNKERHRGKLLSKIKKFSLVDLVLVLVSVMILANVLDKLCADAMNATSPQPKRGLRFSIDGSNIDMTGMPAQYASTAAVVTALVYAISVEVNSFSIGSFVNVKFTRG